MLQSMVRRFAPAVLTRLDDQREPTPLLLHPALPYGIKAVALPLACLPVLKRTSGGKLVCAEQEDVGWDWGQCLPRSIQDASPQRIRSFIAGRLCAEKALQRLHQSHAPLNNGYGGMSTAVDMGPRGEPIWPQWQGQHLIGSITHSERLAAAVVCPKHFIQAIGIDCEEFMDAQCQAAALQLCFTAQELERFPDLARDSALTTLMYATKEAFYKAIWPTVQRFVDFKEVEVDSLDRESGVLQLFSRSHDVAMLLRERWLHCFRESGGDVHALSALIAH